VGIVIADDLFAGAGGWDLAAERLGIHARGVENMKEARATRDAAGLTTIHDDVWTFEPDGKAAGLIASPPCQTFSQAGKGAGREALDAVIAGIRGGFYKDIEALRFLALTVGDDRTGLVLTPLHFAYTGDYEWLAWEQVPTVLPVWEACAEELARDGWSTWAGLMHAEQYGVPQTRKRAVLLASRTGEPDLPTPTHSRYYPRTPATLDPNVQPWVSMAEALGWGLTERPAPTVTGGGTETGGAEPIAKLVERWTTRPDWCYRRPATTIVGTFKPEVVAAPGYRVDVSRQNAPDSVRVTVAEAGVLQSFPADHPWQGAKGKQYLQAGNAIPVGMALHALAEAAGIKAEERAA
jgi:DNA (cytosine-5)-methyltransferase 1